MGLVAKRAGMKLAASLLLGASLAGCSTINDHRGYLVDQALVESVQPGIDNRLSVERTLGRPTFSSQFGEQDWYYVAVDTKQKAFQSPRPVREMVLRVRFDPKGNVAAVDKAGLEHVVKLTPDGHLTPTLGRQRNLLEDLFGNIGAVGTGGGAAAPAGGGGTGPNGS
jgi:outer membrane protein assembly factor BamE (lipoprotein component of BamABCDE complex)